MQNMDERHSWIFASAVEKRDCTGKKKYGEKQIKAYCHRESDEDDGGRGESGKDLRR